MEHCARPLDSSDRCKELNIRGLAHKIHSIVCVHVWCVYVHVHTRVVAEGVLDTEFSLLLFFNSQKSGWNSFRWGCSQNSWTVVGLTVEL